MKNKKKYKAGDVLKIPEKYLAQIIEDDKKTIAYAHLIDDLALKLDCSKLFFWDFILTIFPDIEEFSCTYDRNNQTIIVKNKTKDEINMFQWCKFVKKYKKQFKL